MNDLQLIATSTAGLEAVVKRELTDLGFADARVKSPGRIAFTADLAGLARANLWLRTADRVVLVVGEFEARDFGELFDGVHALPWERWIPADGAFPVRGRSYKSQLSSVPACQKIVKKAVVERLRMAHSADVLPETDSTYTIEVAMREDVAVFTIDTSGAGLHKRGYRAAAGPAPIKETLAAAMVQLSFWRPDRSLVDPFCGSGTIPIEAAMIARNIAPGLKRRFAAEDWPAVGPEIWIAERERALGMILPDLSAPITGTDVEPKAVSLSRHHAELAGVAGDIHFQARSFAELASSRKYGCVICNPPYGKRFENGPDVMGLYDSMAEVFRGLPTWSFYVITSVDLEKALGQQADRRRKLYHGRIEVVYYQFHGPRPPKKASSEPAGAESTDDAAGDVAQADGPAFPGRQGPVPVAGPAFGGLKANAASQAEVFGNRLRKMARHLRRWPAKRGVTCYRLYDRDIPEVPLAVDIYEGRLHIAEYDRPHDRTAAQHSDWLEMLAEVAGEVLDVPRDRIYLKRRQRQRGVTQYGKFAGSHAVATVGEGGLKFEVNLSDYLDTGLFLDHRITREMVRGESAGKRVLNLFGYTGTFSVYAAAAGAAGTTTVDLSNTYLGWAQRNLSLNGFSDPPHAIVRADARNFISRHNAGDHYDLAIIDPPTFSNSKRTDEIFDVQRDHITLLTSTAKLMPTGGVIYFSTNFRRFKFNPEYIPSLDSREITKQTIPEDYRNKRIHRCWRMVVR